MDHSNKFFHSFRESSFVLPLPDRFTDPSEPGFVCPDDAVICDAIVVYAASLKYSIGFISRNTPVRFSMNGKIYCVNQGKERDNIYGGSIYRVTCVSES